MGFNKTVRFQSGGFRAGFENSSLQPGAGGLNVFIVSELPEVGNSKYLYLVPDVNQFYRGIPVMQMFMYQNSQWICLNFGNKIDVHGGSASKAAEVYFKTTYLDAAHLLNQKREILDNLKKTSATAEEIATAEADVATAEASFMECRITYAGLRKAAHAEYLEKITAEKNAVKNITSYEGKYDNYQVNENVDDFENGMF